MKSFKKECLNIIKKCREYTEKGEYDELLSYLDLQEIYIKGYKSDTDKAGKYIDALVKDLK